MSELFPDEPSIATGAMLRAALVRDGTDPVAECRRDFSRERKRRALAKAPPAESQQAPPPPLEPNEKSSVVAGSFASNRGARIPNNWVSDGKRPHWLAENDGVLP